MAYALLQLSFALFASIADWVRWGFLPLLSRIGDNFTDVDAAKRLMRAIAAVYNMFSRRSGTRGHRPESK